MESEGEEERKRHGETFIEIWKEVFRNRGDRNAERQRKYTERPGQTDDKHRYRERQAHSEGLPFSLPGPSRGSVCPRHLVTEDLDLADSTVHQALSAQATVIGINLQIQGNTLYPLLRGEVCAEAVDTNEYLGTDRGAE